MADDASLLIRVFTHPACGGCGAAVQAAWQVHEANPAIVLRTVSLESKPGLDEAHAEGITTIPTMILSRGTHELARWVGSVSRAALETGVQEAIR